MESSPYFNSLIAIEKGLDRLVHQYHEHLRLYPTYVKQGFIRDYSELFKMSDRLYLTRQDFLKSKKKRRPMPFE